ncbi:hypothetical protein D3C75_965820 [compost metagenome]
MALLRSAVVHDAWNITGVPIRVRVDGMAFLKLASSFSPTVTSSPACSGAFTSKVEGTATASFPVLKTSKGCFTLEAVMAFSCSAVSVILTAEFTLVVVVDGNCKIKAPSLFSLSFRAFVSWASVIPPTTVFFSLFAVTGIRL